jgi:hypothetical protein
MRAASMTSWPTPSPGIQAIVYFDMVATLSVGVIARKFGWRRGERSPLKTPKDAKGQKLNAPFLALFRAFSGWMSL